MNFCSECGNKLKELESGNSYTKVKLCSNGDCRIEYRVLLASTGSDEQITKDFLNKEEYEQLLEV